MGKVRSRPGRAGWGAIACLLAASAATAGPHSRAAVAALVQEEMAAQSIPGLAIAIIEHGHVRMARGFGYANVEHAVPVTAATVFQSGSVGKQFTAAAVMLLVEEGKLSLDDPIGHYLPEAPPSWQAIRIRHLLTHTSGIADYTTEAFDVRRAYTEAELVRTICALPLEFPAGERYSYSNSGYLLLGAIMDRVSGRHYSELLRERVFQPLGMHSARLIDEAAIVMHRAAGYRLLDGKLANQAWVAPEQNTTADGSLYLSLADMIAWDRGVRAGRVLRPESWRQIFTPVRLNSGNPYPYGFGWELPTVNGQQVESHDGGWQGFSVHISRYLGSDISIIVLTNLAEGDPARIARRVAATLRDELRAPARAASADSRPDSSVALAPVD